MQTGRGPLVGARLAARPVSGPWILYSGAEAFSRAKEIAMNPAGEVDPAVSSAPERTDRDRPQPYSSLVQVDLAGQSHPGKVRPQNEDHFLIGRFGRFLETVQTDLP